MALRGRIGAPELSPSRHSEIKAELEHNYIQNVALFPHRMEKSMKIFVSAVLFAMSVGICLAQHWSYGLQPGGKRSAEDLVESLQEVGCRLQLRSLSPAS